MKGVSRYRLRLFFSTYLNLNVRITSNIGEFRDSQSPVVYPWHPFGKNLRGTFVLNILIIELLTNNGIRQCVNLSGYMRVIQCNSNNETNIYEIIIDFLDQR